MYLHKGSWGHLGSNRRGWQIIGKGEEEKEVGAKETFVPCHILLRRRQTIRNGGFVCRVNRVGRMSIKIQRSNVSMDWWHLDGHRGHNTWWKIYFHLHYYFKIIKIIPAHQLKVPLNYPLHLSFLCPIVLQVPNHSAFLSSIAMRIDFEFPQPWSKFWLNMLKHVRHYEWPSLSNHPLQFPTLTFKHIILLAQWSQSSLKVPLNNILWILLHLSNMFKPNI